jgi:hypothetical protein
MYHCRYLSILYYREILLVFRGKLENNYKYKEALLWEGPICNFKYICAKILNNYRFRWTFIVFDMVSMGNAIP